MVKLRTTNRRFVVRPALARFFVGAYMLLKEKVSEEEGNLVFGLAKPLSDNLVFYGYSSASLSCPWRSREVMSTQSLVAEHRIGWGVLLTSALRM